MPERDLPDVVLAVVLAGVILFIGIAVLNPLAIQTDDTGDSRQIKTHALFDTEGEFTQLNNGEGFSETVYNSRGYAINLTGASDSYFESESTFNISKDNTFTLSFWGRVDQDATAENMTAVSLNGRLIVFNNRTSDAWSAWYYNESTRDSYTVTVSDTTQPETFANVIVRSNGTHLGIYHNGTIGEVVNLSTSNISPAPNAANWNGRIEELRTFDDALDSTNRSELVSSPIAPQPNTNRTSRAMFDEPYATDQLLFFTSTRLETSNATYDSGFDGSVMNPRDALFGTADYAWKTDGPKIASLEGGDLEDQPVAYVDYTFESDPPLGNFVQEWTNAVGLAGVAILVVVLSTIVVYLQQARGR